MKRALAVLFFAALLAACAPDQPLAPAVSSSPLFLIGETPTNHLIGDTPTITYSAVDGGFTVHTAVNAGLLRASQQGNATFAIRTELGITDTDGDGIVVVDGCPLSDIKVDLADPRPDPLIVIDFFVAWDGKDSEGEPMTGTVGVSYTMGVVHTGAVFEPNNDLMTLGGGPVTGFFDITIVPQEVQ